MKQWNLKQKGKLINNGNVTLIMLKMMHNNCKWL